MGYILIIDTQKEVCRATADLLTPDGFEVISEVDSGDGISRLMQRTPGLVIMSESMPPLDTIELLPLARRLTSSPIIVIGDGGETAVVKCLLQGADVYLSKPVNCRELHIRARSLYRDESVETNEYSRTRTRYMLSENDLSKGLLATLTRTEERLLRCLMESAGEVIRHEDLMSMVWGETVKKERLRFYIHSLRRKLMSESISLLTLNGIGYRLLPMA
ncbi:MAG: response regulator transcription factor [Chloroflexi bacterium]|nr:response regulator transcription factor [Chloroflexota bacterium]